MSENDVIKVENVSKTLKGKTVLRDVSLTLERGKIYAFCGRNASGKTMLLSTIAGLIVPTRGSVTVFGQRVSEKRIYPENMGLIIGSIGLWPHITGMENLALIAEIKKTADIDDMREAMSRVGLDPDDKRKYKAYSMGMKQKLILAQAIMEKPDLLILDEPTNGLDEDAVVLFREIVAQEKKRGVTILIATHQLDDISGLHDCMYTMRDGLCEKGRRAV